MKIPKYLIPLAYKVSRKVYDGEISHSAGVKLLVGDDLMNQNSASDYIYNFRCLMEGREFSRTLNKDSMEYFFENIFKDFGPSGLEKPLSALMKHIGYYEGQQKTTMREMRRIHAKYSRLAEDIRLIYTQDQLKTNIRTFENYLTGEDEKIRFETLNLIKRGICFVVYADEGEIRFAPSRFLGYIDNDLERHMDMDRDGRDTNRAINAILKSKPMPDDELEDLYLHYCHSLGLKVSSKEGSFGVQRKFWLTIVPFSGKEIGKTQGDFEEGRIVERIHRNRERNSQVLKLAKQQFKEKHGKLFCQVCRFSFEDTYGEVGKDFIEGHHTVAVSEMQPGHKTSPEDFAMLCSNCHRMVHRRRPWLTMENLSVLLKIS